MSIILRTSPSISVFSVEALLQLWLFLLEPVPILWLWTKRQCKEPTVELTRIQNHDFYIPIETFLRLKPFPVANTVKFKQKNILKDSRINHNQTRSVLQLNSIWIGPQYLFSSLVCQPRRTVKELKFTMVIQNYSISTRR